MDALGVDRFCTNQTRVAMAPHFASHCEKYRINAAPTRRFHNPSVSSQGSPACGLAAYTLDDWSTFPANRAELIITEKN